MISAGKTAIEKKLLKRCNWIEKIVYDGVLRGYRLYVKGVFGLPSFRDYFWLKGT